MTSKRFPPLPLAAWQDTRATLHAYARVLGAVRAALGPRQQHSQHRSLRLAAAGLTTTPMPAGALTVEALLDLANHQLRASNSRGERWQAPLRGQAPRAFFDQVIAGLRALGCAAAERVDAAPFQSEAAGAYDPRAVERFWLALSQVELVLRRFKGELRNETSDIQFWPHGFDLAMLWFSGRRVPGQDPNVPRNADEQMNFGFSTGDDSLPEPYFYATAYPLPPELPAAPLPPDAAWHTRGWQGAVLRYAALVEAAQAEERLLAYWRAAQAAGARLMRGA